MRPKVGDVLRLDIEWYEQSSGELTVHRAKAGEAPWIVLDVRPYEASAHNDSWHDQEMTLGELELSGNGTYFLTGFERRATTADVFAADIEVEVNIPVIKEIKYTLDTYVKQSGRHRKPEVFNARQA